MADFDDLVLSVQRDDYYGSLIPLGVGFFWVAFDRKNQGWHDKMANSVVIHPAGIEPVHFQRKSDWRVAPKEPTA